MLLKLLLWATASSASTAWSRGGEEDSDEIVPGSSGCPLQNRGIGTSEANGVKYGIWQIFWDVAVAAECLSIMQNWF